MSYSKYVPANERPVITMMIRLIREQGYLVSVSDGYETVLEDSANQSEIRSALGGTGEDFINIVPAAGEPAIGYFYCIYNNGSEGEPMIVISDYTVGEVTESIYAALDAKYG